MKCDTADKVLDWDLGKPGTTTNCPSVARGKLLHIYKKAISKILSEHKAI